jgi:arginine N-succinyltransferase
MLLRPVRLNDHEAVLSLAKTAGFGMTSLPADSDVLYEKIQKSVLSFSKDKSIAGEETFLFVLEDSDGGEVVGTTGIKAHIGLTQPFYSYKITTITQQCKELQIFSRQELLHFTNDLTGSSEIGSLFLLPHYRRDGLGRLLSLSRFLFIAAFKEYFASQVIAEMRGVHDDTGASPFYDSIAKPFFQMEFPKADYINATKGNEFINDLMPRNSIYVSLLPQAARDVIGQPHPNSVAARAMLEREGFRFQGYIDIFDGGPTLQAYRDHIYSVANSRIARVESIDDTIESEKQIISNERFDDFRCCLGSMAPDGANVIITSHLAKTLNVNIGDAVRYVPHKAR